MASSFRARMPRKRPEPGQSYLIVSTKDSRGVRAEVVGTVDDEHARDAVRRVLDLWAKEDEQEAGK